MLPNQHLTRQSDLIPTSSLGIPVTILGVGAIGSHVAVLLAKMGMSDITVIDYDIVDYENLNSQAYRWSDVGRPKVDALADIVQEDANVKIQAECRKYDSGQFQGIVVCAVDSMAVRRTVYDAHKDTAYGVKWIIDSRMAAEFAALYTYRPTEQKDCVSYEKTLYSDEKAVQERCTAKATGYTATLLAGLVVRVVKDIILGTLPPKEVQWAINSYEQLVTRR